mmetsp:Transcript_4247/g.27089  ORF Transcript_4247/g.27089 Transcript_4247/m.27089 type:complete len:189 (-) Transcript_4247:2595-3161(-)
MYKEECVHKFDKMEQTLLEENGETKWNNLDAIAHQLKGSSASIGAPKTSKACAQLREAGGRKDLERCKALMKEVREAFDEYIEAAEQLLSSVEEQTKSTEKTDEEEKEKEEKLEEPSNGSPNSKEPTAQHAPTEEQGLSNQETTSVPHDTANAANPNGAETPREKDEGSPKEIHGKETEGKPKENKDT